MKKSALFLEKTLKIRLSWRFLCLDPVQRHQLPGQQGVEGVIDEIRTAVIDGNSWYYFRLIGEDWFYAVSAGQCETAVILDKGDKVTILGAAEEGQIRQAGSIVEN